MRDESTRYQTATWIEAIGWLLHDVCVHPVTGIAGFIGKLLTLMPSTAGLRVMTLGHHFHNATAPSNDVLADYAHATALACHNELYPGHVQSRDEVEHNFEQAWKLGWRPGDDDLHTDVSMHKFMKKKGVKPWQTAIKDNYERPAIVSEEEAENKREENVAKLELDDATSAQETFLARRITPRQWRQMSDQEKQALQDEADRLAEAVTRARRALDKVRGGMSLKDLLLETPGQVPGDRSGHGHVGSRPRWPRR
jgi:hypothetical protein